MLDRAGRLRYTDVFDQREDQILERSVVVDQALERNELLNFLPGAQLTTLKDGALRILWDYDNPLLQKQSILHGNGEFEREPIDGATTPNPSRTPYHLVLQKGQTRFIYDRPLAYRSPFDPALPIEFSATINTLAGSYLLAIDIDGVKVAICSADPRLHDRRFPPETPLLEGESKLPEFNTYGMGRGVGFHRAATADFGSSFSDPRIWTFPSAGRGRNVKAWRDPKRMARPKVGLFAFARGTTYRIRVLRELDRLRLYVDDRLVGEMQHADWGNVGTYSDRRSDMSHGTGRIQLLTWTPLVVDDVAMVGTPSRRWIADSRRDLARRKKASDEGGRRGSDD